MAPRSPASRLVAKNLHISANSYTTIYSFHGFYGGMRFWLCISFSFPSKFCFEPTLCCKVEGNFMSVHVIHRFWIYAKRYYIPIFLLAKFSTLKANKLSNRIIIFRITWSFSGWKYTGYEIASRESVPARRLHENMLKFPIENR